MLPDGGVFTPKHVGAFNVNFNANLKLFLRLSNCASVDEKNFDNYQDARYVRENHIYLFISKHLSCSLIHCM